MALYLTERALRDIDKVDSFSVERWGERVATQYLDDINSALQRLDKSPSLLREREGLSLRLAFYRVREHVLICDVIKGDVFVLAVRHTAMDLPRRLAELEPRLVEEAEMLAQWTPKNE